MCLAARATRVALLLATALAVVLPLEGPWGGARMGPPPARADERWEEEVVRARREQDRLIQRAQDEVERRNLITLYRNRAKSRPIPLNHYLLGRALFYLGHEDGAQAPMQEALRLDAGFWYAELGLAQLALRARDPETARRLVNSVRARKPGDLNALKMDAQLKVMERRWQEGLTLLEQVLSQATDRREQLGLRHLMAECALELEQWELASQLLEGLLRELGEDPVIAWQYAVALYELGRDEDVLRLLDRILATSAASATVLSLKQSALARLERWDEWIEVLRALEPLLPEGDARQRVRGNLEAHAAGQRPGTPPAEFRRDPLAEILQRAAHPTDVEVRREALHRYYEGDVPFVDRQIVERYSPTVEPDALCRVWVLRILGRFQRDVTTPEQCRQVSVYLALGLDDPESRVRKVAAEELGELGEPAALIYLLSAIVRIPLAPLPTDEELQRALEEEFNALRISISRVSGRRDLPIVGGNWARLEQAAELQAGWQQWAHSPAATGPLLTALGELDRLEQAPGLWMVSWAPQFVLEPYGDEVAVAAYRLIRDECAALDARARDTPLSRNFPLISDEQLVKEGVAAMRERVRAWWREFLQQRARR